MSKPEEATDALKADRQEYACLLYEASLEWAETSFTKLDESEHPDQPFGSQRHHAAQTVGYVCLSYALEFAYKALLLANDTWLKKQRTVSRNFTPSCRNANVTRSRC